MGTAPPCPYGRQLVGTVQRQVTYQTVEPQWREVTKYREEERVRTVWERVWVNQPDRNVDPRTWRDKGSLVRVNQWMDLDYQVAASIRLLLNELFGASPRLGRTGVFEEYYPDWDPFAESDPFGVGYWGPPWLPPGDYRPSPFPDRLPTIDDLTRMLRIFMQKLRQGQAVDDPFIQSVDDWVEIAGRFFGFTEKLRRRMIKRAWTRDQVISTINNPHKRMKSTDSRYFPDRSGRRMNDPCTVYFDKDGKYVVVNDRSGEIIQVSKRDDPDWKDDDRFTPYE